MDHLNDPAPLRRPPPPKRSPAVIPRYSGGNSDQNPILRWATNVDVQLMALIFVGMSIYVLLYIENVTLGFNNDDYCFGTGFVARCTGQLHDSYSYFLYSENFKLSSALSDRVYDFSEGKAASAFTNIGLYIQGYFARLVFPFAPEYSIFVTNFILYAATAYKLHQVARISGLRFGFLSKIVFVYNPLVILNTAYLNKEIWCVFCAVFVLDALIRRKILWAAFYAVICIMFRDFMFVVLAAIIGGTYARIRFVWVMLAVSLVFPFILQLPFMAEAARVHSTRMLDIGTYSGEILQAILPAQKFPLGHLLVSPIIVLINFVAPTTTLARGEVVGVFPWAVTLSSVISTLGLGVAGWGLVFGSDFFRSLKSRPRWITFEFIVLGLFMLSLYPLSQHRYYLPMFPMLALLLSRNLMASRPPRVR